MQTVLNTILADAEADAAELAATGQSVGALWWLVGAAAVVVIIGAALLLWRGRASRHRGDR